MFQKLSLRRCTPLQLSATLMLALPLAVVITAIAAVLMTLMGVTNNVAQVTDPPNLILVIVALCVFPAVGEELLFRGFLSRGLIARHGTILGVVFATLLFAMAHIGAVQVIGIFFMGLVMQLVFMWTRSLPASMLLHGVYNTLVILFTRNAPLEPAALDMLEVAFLPLVATSLITVAALLIVLYQSRTRWLLPDGSDWMAGRFTTEMPPKELGAVAANSGPRALPMTVATLGLVAVVVMMVLVVA